MLGDHSNPYTTMPQTSYRVKSDAS